jgi:hypothetical protein
MTGNNDGEGIRGARFSDILRGLRHSDFPGDFLITRDRPHGDFALSFPIVKNDSERVSMARAQPAYAVTQIHPVRPARALHGSMMYRKNHAVSLFQSDDFRAGLHARSLFRQNELAAREISARDRKQNDVSMGFLFLLRPL